MGFFRSNGKAAERNKEQPIEEESGSENRGRSSDRSLPPNSYHRRRSSTLSRNSSSRSVSCSAKTIKCGTGLRIFGGSGNSNTTTNTSRSASMSTHQAINRFRAMYKSNNDLSVRSIISDLDLESAEMEMAPIGEDSEKVGTKRIAGLGPQHEPNQDTDGTSSELYGTSSELYVSADFTLASNCNNSRTNSRKSGKSKNSKGSKSGSYGSNNDSSGEIFDSVSIASASVMMDRSRAENVGRSSTKFVYIILLITGIVLSTIVYFTLKQFETNRFELEFRSYARETADLAETNAYHTFSQLETMATTVTSEGMLERERIQYHNASHEDFPELETSWPNVTIPHFDERIADFSTSFGAIMLLYVPLVQSKDREQWEYYANVHAPWKPTAKSRDDALVDVNSADYLHIHPCNFLHVDDIREGFNVNSFAEDVLENEGGFENPQGMAAPVYQYGGPGHQRNENSEIALMDLFQHPIFKKDVIASIEYDVPVISEYMDVGFLRGALSTIDPEGDASSLWNSKYSVYYNEENNDVNTGKDAIMTLPSIRSLTLHPVKETFEPGARTIGFVVGVVPWHTYFRNVLKTSTSKGNSSSVSFDVSEKDENEVNGIVVKVVSNCGSTFTFVLNSGNSTIEVHLGDWKEEYEEYEHLNHTSRFFYQDHPEGHSRHCSFDLNIYPNNNFRDSYRTNSPQNYALVVAGIFLFTAFLFACYDRLIFKGQQYIVNEATGMIVANAQRAAKNERELNDFIAHEVRNPLAAAISACSFVSSAIMEDQGRSNNGEGGETERLALIASAEKRKEVLDDVNIIDSSLHFINDLLRNMLDMQRAGSNQIRIERKPTDIMNDVFKPVGAMIHLRDVPFKVILECNVGIQSGDAEEDEQLFVMTDPMRLKQVLLNLTRNATKFVEKGFIRCTAHVNPINGYVELRVDDSGPGIAPEKRSQVFGKFQESLDSLQQGTGIGLSLCKKMIDLMGGSLFIDEDYNSGIDGCPGTRFVIQLKIPPLQLNKMMFEPKMSSIERAKMRRLHISVNTESPEKPLSFGSNLTDSVRSSVSSASKEISFESGLNDSEADRHLQEPAGTLSESFVRIGEVMEDEEDSEEKKQGSTMLPLPTALRLNPTGEVLSNDSPDTIDDPKDQQPDKKAMITELPKNFSVLFVDDDMVLRKLFSRTLRKINPTWKCKEASSGETAIELITSASECKEGFRDEETATANHEEVDCGFDLIFMDQYMASVQKQLLGTETVRAIRAKGFNKPIICGLSANDVEDAFYHAGADAFMFKPFPCKKDELEKELLKVINSRVRRR